MEYRVSHFPMLWAETLPYHGGKPYLIIPIIPHANGTTGLSGFQTLYYPLEKAKSES
jgi:hypothetical protein